MNNFKKITICLLLSLPMIVSCEKSFLEAKPDKSLLIPRELSDFQALLNNYQVMNFSGFLTATAVDDIYTTNAGYTTALELIRNAYIWKEGDMYGTSNVGDWNTPFQAVYYANVVLDGLSEIQVTAENQKEADRLKGQALFYRAFSFYSLAQQFAKPYSSANQNSPGIPIRLKANVQIKSVRGTLEQTYKQILEDLLAAEALLPLTVSFKSMPKKDACLALLARVYLTMHNYSKALEYADKCLQINSQLLNYNNLVLTSARPFPVSYKDQNNEVLFSNNLIIAGFLTSPTTTLISTELYNSYRSDDLRKTAFFTTNSNGVIFKGNYSGSGAVFSGLALDEVFLIRAECHARLGNTLFAMNDLNTLMRNRWNNKVPFPVFTATDAKDALRQILTERRKELVYRNTRWTDLRRLNQENDFAVTLTRNVNNVVYTLAPNSNRYVFSIPEYEIAASGIEQNER